MSDIRNSTHRKIWENVCKSVLSRSFSDHKTNKICILLSLCQ